MGTATCSFADSAVTSLTCTTGFVLDNFSKKVQVLTALVSVPICVLECPKGYWNNTNVCEACGVGLFCGSCTDGTTCTSCNTTTKAVDPADDLCKNVGSFTIASCPAGTFEIKNGAVITSCAKCHPYCETCREGPSNADCLICLPTV